MNKSTKNYIKKRIGIHIMLYAFSAFVGFAVSSICHINVQLYFLIIPFVNTIVSISEIIKGIMSHNDYCKCGGIFVSPTNPDKRTMIVECDNCGKTKEVHTIAFKITSSI